MYGTDGFLLCRGGREGKGREGEMLPAFYKYTYARGRNGKVTFFSSGKKVRIVILKNPMI